MNQEWVIGQLFMHSIYLIFHDSYVFLDPGSELGNQPAGGEEDEEWGTYG